MYTYMYQMCKLLYCICCGPRYNPSSVAAVLSDKSHLKHTRDVYKNFEYESNNPDECLDEEGDREDYQRSYLCDQDMYNDEYDDTYDSHDVGVADSVTTDEVFAVKRYVLHVDVHFGGILFYYTCRLLCILLKQMYIRGVYFY